MERKSGVVHEFSAETGLGRIDSGDGRSFGFHLTQIADGTRTIALNSHVGFDVVAGRLGQWEAVNIEPSTHPSHPLFGDADDETEGDPGIDEQAEAEEFEDESFPCPVCGAGVEGEAGEYEICATCNWEDDPVQSNDPSFSGGANEQSLNTARLAWNSKPSPT
jgi:cold shock CspA family protein